MIDLKSTQQEPQQLQEEAAAGGRPSMIIVGAGLGGLMLAILLERMGGIDYMILERASQFKTLGAAMSMGPNILPVFEQLGMLDELMAISMECPTAWQMDSNLKPMGEIKMKGQKPLTGYESILFTRPALFHLLLSKVPAHKILLSKRVLKIEDSSHGGDLDDDNVGVVRVTCSDNSVYTAEIVVGADGTYSAVRQNIYKELEEVNKLPKSDKEPLKAGFTCMVGITNALDPEKYPELNDDIAHFRAVIGGRQHSWGGVNNNDKTFCWQLNLQYLNENEAKRQQFMNSEWGPTSNKDMINEFYDLKNPYGIKGQEGKMGDFIDATPPELISKVFLEHKMFKTWYHGRVVLIGDGAMNAMQDAVVLANCLYELDPSGSASASPRAIRECFHSFYEQRYEPTKAIYNFSEFLSRIMCGLTWTDRLLRTIMLKYMPPSFQQYGFKRTAGYRPQIRFMELAVNRGSIPVLPQKPCKRYEDEKQRRKSKGKSKKQEHAKKAEQVKKQEGEEEKEKEVEDEAHAV
ncbi:hypothetical protein BGZ83_006443 [Gryganskiella cystojenkinii]|nr:hypothetical protein BGZ83_006443 [Gryganskiella cystojenkinii]